MKQIIVRGGAHAKGLLFFKYLVEQTGKKNPNILYISTAGGNSDYFARQTYDNIIAAGGIPKSLSLFEPVPTDLVAFVSQFDIVYVGGGNTRSELILWRAWELDKALDIAAENGTILSGVSAGGLCWFQSGTTDSWAGPLRAITGSLGFLPYSHCPHYDGEVQRRPTYHHMVASGELPAGYAVDDAAFIHFQGGKLKRTLTLETGKTAYWVEAISGEARETPLEAELYT